MATTKAKLVLSMESDDMTQAPLKPCKRPGCPATTRDRGGYCPNCLDYGEQHTKQQRANRYRQRPKKTDPFYGTARWQRFRGWYRRNHPLCEDCLEHGRVVPVYCVDHVKEIKDGGEPLSEDNARSLCRRCHAVKTAAVRRKRSKGLLWIHFSNECLHLLFRTRWGYILHRC